MKPISKPYCSAVLIFFLATGGLFASTNDDLFKAVPAGETTYTELQTLELAGLIPEGAADKTLTRYEVADLILKAQKNYEGIVVADANTAPAVPPPTLPDAPVVANSVPAPAAPPALPDAPASSSIPSAAAPDLPSAPPVNNAVPVVSATPASSSESSAMNNAAPSAPVADEDYTPPPPPSESVMNSDNTAAAATPPVAAPTAQPTPNYAQHPELLVNAEAALQSLDQAYEVELLAVMQAKGIMLDDLNKAESDQYQLWRDVKAMTDSPSVSLHGIGRMFGTVEQIYGPFSLTGQSVTVTHTGGVAVTTLSPVNITNPETQYMNGYLDFNPMGTITKQLQWDAIMRLGSSGLPLTGVFGYNNAFDTANNVNYDTLNFRRISMHFSPDFMSMDIGDFFESYTPLTLWNRNNLDLYYKPEMIARADDEYKYESFFNHEPDWPFRGIRLGTALGWPDSNLLDRFQVSAFVHMISNGFDDWPNGGWLFSSNNGAPSLANPGGNTNFFTDFIYAGHADLDFRKWYLGDLSVQLSAHVYEVILDEIVDNANPTDYLGTVPGSGLFTPVPITEYLYNPNDPNTWAHQYRITSMRPEMKVGFGGDVYLGLQYEGSFAAYQDDKIDPARTISDFAVYANPYLQFDDSKVTFNYLNVGPNYYSPLAQTRQDYITPLTGTTTTAAPGLISGPLRGQFFLLDQRTFENSTGYSTTTYIDVPRPNELFSFYDRTQDAVFPYGLATPDREGIGFDFDIKSMPDKAFKLPGSIYFLNEIAPNYVVNSGGNTYVPVDALPNGQAPNRSFVYVNLGPSVDLGPAFQMKTPFELGTNLRYEQTNLNNLTGNYQPLVNFWWLTGLRVGLFKWWEVAVAGGIRTSKGTDMGYDGTTLARYSYIYDNQDLGDYSLFTVNDSLTDILLSTTFNMDSHSKLHFDYSLETGTNNGSVVSGIIPGAALNGTINTQYAEVTYEIQF